MELLSPAGNLEKLKYAYLYGADAAYIGIRSFSLRTRADNFSSEEWRDIARIKGKRKLYCAMNIFFHNRDLEKLENTVEYISQYPFDAFIVSDLGAYSLLRRYFPESRFHLSTQANCINRDSAKMYRDLGFSRIILGRETPLRDIAEIRRAVPEVELEAFVHGAMCVAYSGRCFLSTHMADRSANQGDCTHSCRWNYRVLEEKQRPGEYFPVIEGEDFTSILSSKDLCMFDHLRRMKDAGVNSIKIEGRMKSLYYTAVVTRSYRKALEIIESPSESKSEVPSSIPLTAYREELFKISHREFSTGFYFGTHDADETTRTSYHQQYHFLGTVGRELSNGRFELHVKNHISTSTSIEFIGPDILFLEDNNFKLFDSTGSPVHSGDHGKKYSILPSVPVRPGYILRSKETPASAVSSTT